MYIKKFFSYLKPYRGILVFDLTFAVISSITALAFPLLVKTITEQLTQGDTSNVLKISIIMVVLVIVHTIANFYISHQGHMMGAMVENDMRNELFAHYQSLSHEFYDDNNVGKLMSHLSNDIYYIGELAHHGPEEFVITLVSILGALFLMFRINVRLAVVTLLTLPIMILIIVIIHPRMNKAYQDSHDVNAEISGFAQENLSGHKVIKSFSLEEKEKERFKGKSKKFLDAKSKVYFYEILFYEGMEGIILLIPVFIIVFGSYNIFVGSLSLSDLLAFFLLISSFTNPIQKFMSMMSLYQEGTTGFIRVQNVLRNEPTIISGKENLVSNNSIEFKNVSFSYDEKSEKVLDSLNLKIEKEEFVALVGPSGAGKTTICNLIPRFYDVTEGAIEIDGVDIRNVSLEDLRSRIGIVQQDTYLFSGTIEENIRYGNHECSLDEVVEASKKANAHEFIMSLPRGYDTHIGYLGFKLSGGQRQRISIARVFLKNPGIIIFDEATSALDNNSEHEVLESMNTLVKGKVAIVIAHRLSTIKHADRILFVEDGSIIESGTHQELLERNGKYAQLYREDY